MDNKIEFVEEGRYVVARLNGIDRYVMKPVLIGSGYSCNEQFYGISQLNGIDFPSHPLTLSDGKARIVNMFMLEGCLNGVFTAVDAYTSAPGFNQRELLNMLMMIGCNPNMTNTLLNLINSVSGYTGQGQNPFSPMYPNSGFNPPTPAPFPPFFPFHQQGYQNPPFQGPATPQQYATPVNNPTPPCAYPRIGNKK